MIHMASSLKWQIELKMDNKVKNFKRWFLIKNEEHKIYKPRKMEKGKD